MLIKVIRKQKQSTFPSDKAYSVGFLVGLKFLCGLAAARGVDALFPSAAHGHSGGRLVEALAGTRR